MVFFNQARYRNFFSCLRRRKNSGSAAK